MSDTIEYGNPIWTSDPAAAMREARRRIEVAAATDWDGRPPTLWFYDLNALEALPAEIASIPDLKQILFFTDEKGRRKLRGRHALADCDALRSLHEVRVLELWETHILDLSPVSHLGKLTELYICGTQIDDLSALAGLRHLRVLNASITAVDDLGPVSGLATLEDLYVSRTAISDLGPLAQLSRLATLFVNHTEVREISALGELRNLTTLNLNGTHVADLAPLSGLGELRDLDLSGSQVKSLDPLGGLASLSILDLTGTQVDDLSPLLRIPAFASGLAQGLTFAETPVAQLESQPRLAELAKLPRKECAVETVRYLEEIGASPRDAVS